MPTQSGAPTGVGGGGMDLGGGAGLSQNVMPQPMGPGGGAATSDVIGVPGQSQFGGLGAAIKGMQNMLGNTQEERETNAKALASAVKDIGGIVSTMGETTLLKRMMEAQGNGLGFIEPGGSGPAVSPPGPTGGGVMAPIMSGLGYK